MACAKNLRYGVDVFGTLSLLIPSDGYARQTEILNALENLVEKRRNKLAQIVRIFGRIINFSRSNERKWTKTFEKGLELLSEVFIRENERDIVILKNLTESAQNLRRTVKQLSDTKDFAEAKNVYWNNQSMFWDNLVQADVKFLKSLQELSYQLQTANY